MLDLPQNPILNFFSGPEGPEAFGQALSITAPHMAAYLVELDQARSDRMDLRRDVLFAQMMEMARGGSITAVLAHVPHSQTLQTGVACTLSFKRLLAIAITAYRQN